MERCPSGLNPTDLSVDMCNSTNLSKLQHIFSYLKDAGLNHFCLVFIMHNVIIPVGLDSKYVKALRSFPLTSENGGLCLRPCILSVLI